MSRDSHAYQLLRSLYEKVLGSQRAKQLAAESGLEARQAAYAKLETLEPRLLLSTMGPVTPADDGGTGASTLGAGPTAEIHGSKWSDLNANGVWDAGEPGVADWTVYVDLDEDGQLDAGTEPWTTTAADGSYALTGLDPV